MLSGEDQALDFDFLDSLLKTHLRDGRIVAVALQHIEARLLDHFKFVLLSWQSKQGHSAAF